MFVFFCFFCIGTSFLFQVLIVLLLMKKGQCYLIYDKANSDVARLEWVGDSLCDDANFRKSVKLKHK